VGDRRAARRRGGAMTLLLDEPALDARRSVTIGDGPLAPLAFSLASDLEPLLSRDLYFPREKALLSREGGRCARDGTMLEFDPYQPHQHRCPTCGEVYRGELHDRFWIYWYQLWMAERSVHAALLSRLGGDARFETLASSILDGYVERYLSYPNADNVLGPTRLFFSTYLESIWLLQICIAADLMEARNPSLAARVRDRIVEPSRTIIAEFDEGASNRQVWNDAALLAAGRLLGDDDAAEQAVYGRSGIASHLSNGLLVDGTWYEGENYHLFAHRGLWYGVTMATQAGLELLAPLSDRFQLGFATPFATALPDFTLPSRRDSQYAISLRQWRIAEHCELGVARRADEPLLAALREMYAATGDDTPARNARARSSADVERNAPASPLSRRDLSWRALMFALPQLPVLSSSVATSALLDAQGIAVFRRDSARVYAALDYGHPGGGHGHPDRLNLMLAKNDVRWLDDFGTGSYVDPTLHWYRSSLAHNAPLVDGQSQRRVAGNLLAYSERDGVGWIVAAVDEIAPGTSVSRTLVVLPDYCLDIVDWAATRTVAVDLPMHLDAEIVNPDVELASGSLKGADGVEDGFDFVRETAVQRIRAFTAVQARATTATNQEELMEVFAQSDGDCEWWRATAPGAPGKGDHRFRVLRVQGTAGRHRLVWSWNRAVVDVAFDAQTIVVKLRDGAEHRHSIGDDGWRIEMEHASRSRVIELGGVVEQDQDEFSTEQIVAEGLTALMMQRGAVTHIELGEAHYRRSEQSWRDAGEPRASVLFAWNDDALHVVVDVPRSDRTFVPANVVNMYDNEPAQINGDSVELFVRDVDGARGWLFVPIIGGNDVQQRAIDGWKSSPSPRATWRETAQGYELDIVLDARAENLAMDVVVNEMPRGRTRRRGQLALSGGANEWVYLRGDRHESWRLIPLRLSDA